MFAPSDRVKTMALDYMTDTRDALKVTWKWLWHRGKGIPLGGFALYLKKSDDDPDDTMMSIWANEGLPHPKVNWEWNLEGVKKWLDEWKKEFTDTSVLWYTFPKNAEEFKKLLPYMKKADIKQIHLAPWTWHSGKHHCEINDKFFKDGSKGFKEMTDFLRENGIGVTVHYNFCEIKFDDPVYVGTKPNKDLATWGSGKLLKSIDKKETTIIFEPAPGVELPFIPPWYHVINPPALSPASNYKYFRIGDEMIKVGEILNSDTNIWILKDCTRGLGSTNTDSHDAGKEMLGMVVMRNYSFMPGFDTELFDTMTSELAYLLNYYGLPHIEYDGLMPCYMGNSEWSYRQWTADTYSKLDHPVTYFSGFGDALPFAHFELRFNSVKKMRGYAGGFRGSIGARVRTVCLSNTASTLDEAHFRMSQVVALDKNDFPIYFAVHYPADWQNYGIFDDLCQTVADWKAVSKLMTDEQRAQIRKTLYPPFHRGYQSDIVWRINKNGKEYRITPGKNPLTRRKGDVRWGCGQGESGYITPWQYVKTGQVMELENPYSSQPPQFEIRVMAAVDYENRQNIVLQPKISEINNPTEITMESVGNALMLSEDNKRNDVLEKRKADILYPIWYQNLDMTSHRAIGMWVTGDGSGSILLLRLPHIRDYAVTLDFKGKRYIEIPNGEAYWSDANWGGPTRSPSSEFNYKPNWFKLGFGSIPARTTAKATVEGIKALKEIHSKLENPVIHVDDGTLKIIGTVETEQYIKYTGGDKVSVYDNNWNKLKELPVTKDNYIMEKGYHKLSVTAGQDAPLPWLAVRYITEGEPIIITER